MRSCSRARAGAFGWGWKWNAVCLALAALGVLLWSDSVFLSRFGRRAEQREEQRQIRLTVELGETETETDGDGAPKLWMLVGECPADSFSHQQAMMANKAWIDRVRERQPRWRVEIVAVDALLAPGAPYSHAALVAFTRRHVELPADDEDVRVQWVFNVDCAKKYRDVKQFYRDAESPRVARLAVPAERATEPRRWLRDAFWDAGMRAALSLSVPGPAGGLRVSRPLLLEEVGEVFDLPRIARLECGAVDVNFQRARAWPRRGCVSVLFVQGAAQRFYPYARANPASVALMDYADLLRAPDAAEAAAIAASKRHFCGFAVKTFWSPKYFADALARHAFHAMLSRRHRYCHQIGAHRDDNEFAAENAALACTGRNPRYARFWPHSHHLLALCLRDFKFSINMENTRARGYTSEKIFTGLLARTVPVYFGNPDLAELVNLDRVVFCNVSGATVRRARAEFDRVKRRANLSAWDAERGLRVFRKPAVLRWAERIFGADLEPCLAEVVRLDGDDAAYAAKLARPAIPGNGTFAGGHYDSTRIADAILEIMADLKSPLFSADI